jgi:hypothetical protein
MKFKAGDHIISKPEFFKHEGVIVYNNDDSYTVIWYDETVEYTHTHSSIDNQYNLCLRQTREKKIESLLR